jgi:uncharacterized membrane protein YobD (UPF0266 family)
MSNETQIKITWEAWEYKHYPKNLGWYVVLTSITLAVMAFFIIVQSDIFAAVSLGIIALLIVFFSRQTPRRVEIELTTKGINFGNIHYPYKQIKHFWIVHNQNHQMIIFDTSAVVNNILTVELEDQDPDMIREFLMNFLPEHTETEPTVTQKIMHTFKF